MEVKENILNCTEGDVLAEDILSPYGAVLLPRGTFINDYIMQKLMELGIEEALIFRMEHKAISKGLFEKSYASNMYKTKRLMQALIKGEKLDSTAVEEITTAIVSTKEETEQIIKFLMRVQEVDDYTYYHSVNVSYYSMLIARWLNLAEKEVKIITQAALLHDVGKAKIPNELLNKREKLTNEEFEELKRHSQYGYEMLKDIKEISWEVKNVVLMHHERDDGSGYPMGLTRDNINNYAKIVAVADVYDAMTSNRTYKQAMTPFNAFEEFFAICRSRLDMSIVDLFLTNLAKYYVGCEVMLSDGRRAKVAYVPPQCPWKPIIALDSQFLDLSLEKELTIMGMI
ncbi:MAG: HD domain-containing phosphohydrolase [Bacillota bacterium]